jgi:deoxyribonuclease-2
MPLSPLDENGNPVDWWFMYKVPKLKASDLTDATTGFEYVYFDSQMAESGQSITRSSYTLDSDNGALFHTLDSLFSNPAASTGWLLYNDEVPPSGPTSSTLGHTKGVLGFDAASDTAFWLLHSWPKFPLPDDSAQPSPMYGQTFLCLALDLDTARQLATQMHQYQEPQVYQPRIPTQLAVDDPLRLLTSGITDQDQAGSNDLPLTTRGGKAFQVIAKNRQWDDDFWNNLVVVDLKVDLDVDTWINGPGEIPGTTDPSQTYHVEDIKYISFEAFQLNWCWPENKDHAKWAISEKNEGNWVCVGDINRKTTQRLRGGCTIAMQEDELWGFLSQTDKFVVPDGSGMTEASARTAVQKAAKSNLAAEAKARAERRKTSTAHHAAPAKKK